MTSLAEHKYLSFTTFRKNGEAKALPVWIVDSGDGTLGFTTGKNSWKVKRLANDSRCELRPCNARGVVTEGAAVATGTARMVEGAEYAKIDELVAQKYGFQRKLIKAISKVGALFGSDREAANCAIVVTLD